MGFDFDDYSPKAQLFWVEKSPDIFHLEIHHDGVGDSPFLIAKVENFGETAGWFGNFVLPPAYGKNFKNKKEAVFFVETLAKGWLSTLLIAVDGVEAITAIKLKEKLNEK